MTDVLDRVFERVMKMSKADFSMAIARHRDSELVRSLSQIEEALITRATFPSVIEKSMTMVWLTSLADTMPKFLEVDEFGTYEALVSCNAANDWRFALAA